jgi:photosystem II stability/assembly factor-like uncharacterized protein
VLFAGAHFACALTRITRLYGAARSGLTIPVAVLQIDSRHPATLLAGTAAAQLFRSSDEAVTWTPLPFPMAFRSTLHAILIDHSRPNIYFVAVSSEISQNAGVFRTQDAGTTWQRLPGLAGKQVWALASWAANSSVIAAGTPEGVFRTTNGGNDWTRLASPGSEWPRPVVSLAFDPTDPDTLYAGTPHLAWKTSNAGVSWRQLSKGMQEDSDIFSIDVSRVHSNELLAGACSGVYRSVNGGVRWSSIELLRDSPRTYVVARTPMVPGLILAGTSAGVIRSADGGATWRRLITIPARSIVFKPSDPQLIFIGTDEGIFLSDDAGQHLYAPGIRR